MQDLDPRWEGIAFDRAHWHFHARLLERYGVRLGPKDFSRMVRDIDSGKAPLVQKRGNGDVYAVKFRSCGVCAFVVRKGPWLVTVAPPSKSLWKAKRAAKG